MQKYDKIAVWNTAFLGDSILTLPLILSLRAAFPDAEIHYFLRPGYADLFSGQPEIDRIRTFDKRGGQKRLWHALLEGRALATEGFDLWCSPHLSFRSALVARAAAAAVRVGYDTPWYNRIAYTHTTDRAFGKMDEIDRTLRLLEPIGVPAVAHWPALVPPSEAAATADAFFDEFVDGPSISLHPGSVWASKRWPARHFAALLDRAVDKGLHVLLMGGPDDDAIARDILNQAQSADSRLVHDLAGKLSLAELAAYLRRVTVHVGGDSGHLHLAWVQSTPVVALFGPTHDSLGFTPRSAHSFIAEVALDCRPCGRHGHRKCPRDHHRCMVDLTPELVWPLVETSLDGAMADGRR
jgi:heptosyltransferase-2